MSNMMRRSDSADRAAQFVMELLAVVLGRNISNISVAQAPTLSVRPVRPNILLNGLLGCVAATMIAFGSVWVTERRQSGEVDEGEKPIENGAPVFGHRAGKTLVQA